MKKLLKHRKALSPVVAAIILIAVTVAVSIAVAAWMGALTIGFMGTEELRITGVTFETPEGSGDVLIDVRNTGSVDSVVVELRCGNKTAQPLDETISAGSTKTLTYDGSYFNWKAGVAYTIEVVTAKGNIFVTRATAPQ